MKYGIKSTKGAHGRIRRQSMSCTKMHILEDDNICDKEFQPKLSKWTNIQTLQAMNG